MNFLARRSIRKYILKEIESEKLDEILKAGLSAPTGKNLKPFELIVIKDKDILKRISSAKDTRTASMLESILSYSNSNHKTIFSTTSAAHDTQVPYRLAL